ncbi:hypothetical protein PCANC_07822 [Puccinia coronata f. sp. avenae]|uniref:Uncharacterized protein n=1 Tax=Puccinia coronata f. sp. avenae TaxID=200324 RepID=A0A2N5SIC3_9BASI|nr:hypothetical protein PCANC_17789 [Puccinia coronata f. sp. avenae]PLW47507.1 hypothetical protein PCANC_07822 [Puccinia coronata f. sp. avenae]
MVWTGRTGWLHVGRHVRPSWATVTLWVTDKAFRGMFELAVTAGSSQARDESGLGGEGERLKSDPVRAT